MEWGGLSELVEVGVLLLGGMAGEEGGVGGGANRRELGGGSRGVVGVGTDRGGSFGVVRIWGENGGVGSGERSTEGRWKGVWQRIAGKGGWMVRVKCA